MSPKKESYLDETMPKKQTNKKKKSSRHSHSQIRSRSKGPLELLNKNYTFKIPDTATIIGSLQKEWNL